MKFMSLYFLALVILITLKVTKVYEIDYVYLAGLIVLFIVIEYIHIHLKNKEKRIPKPVYVTNQY